MTGLGGPLGTLFDLLLVILGFGLIIFVHELGHFLAAKWAGIRVLAFAIGFGPSLVSYRKGLGFRSGSSEKEYIEKARASGDGALPLSPTEYRLNYLPLGGYVKMLGQEDLNPGATSAAPDSYQNCPPWKRMVVISAGVVMNLFTAAILFIAVFMYGLQTEPARIGAVAPGYPAAAAVPINAAVEPGLKAGDVLLEIGGRQPNSFNDLVLATAMNRRDGVLRVSVEREGIDHPVIFEMRPRQSDRTRLLEIGVEPPRSPFIHNPSREADRRLLAETLQEIGLPGVEAGMRLVRVGSNTNIRGAEDFILAVRNSGGIPFEIEFSHEESGRRAVITVQPQPAMQLGHVQMPAGSLVAINHLLGLTPVMTVASANERSQGLQAGDIFARVGSLEFPSLADGIAEIHRHYGREIEVAVLRADGEGRLERIALTPTVRRKGNGQIGFAPGDTAEDSTLLSIAPRFHNVNASSNGSSTGDPLPLPAASIITRPGLRILEIDGVPVATFAEIRQTLRALTTEARATESGATVSLTVELPLPDQPGGWRPVQNIDWTLSAHDIKTLHDLGWTSPIWIGIFDPEQFILRAGDPISAIKMGIAETHRVMMMTYLTFARLFQGTVKVEHLKGPVGIAHMGTRIAERGFIWLLFFMALISVNLAVINFLPLPIVDGGQFIFLLIEQVRGKPVPVEVQNAATLAGLLLIGAVFIIVTFHDIANLFG